ncbi:MAG: enoyl-CoA hydratase/isomerase family protein [Burkholderiaceae bacterium]
MPEQAFSQDLFCLQQAQIPGPVAQAWQVSIPLTSSDFASDCGTYARFWQGCSDLLASLPDKPQRSSAQELAAQHINQVARQTRMRFLDAHVTTVYERLTGGGSRHVRVERLVHEAALLVPGLTPNPVQLNAEAQRMQRDKEGHEIDQGIFISKVLAQPSAGMHLCHAMLLPRPESIEQLAHFEKSDYLDLGAAEVFRRGRACHVVQKNPRHLNAEDNSTLDAAETAVDLAILEPQSQFCVLRGDVVQGGKYDGKRMLGSGINLTHLYHGKIPFVWYLQRDLGIVNKIFRGLASHDQLPDDVNGQTREKPWMAVVEQFAIGGHCQYLLTMDYVLAERGAFLSLPARKEGIIPGAANMRLPRFIGNRLARQAIMLERRLDCDTPEGRLICDEIVDPVEMEQAIERVVDNFTGSGLVSAAANRRALRVVQEPLDLFRRYFAAYALDQAYCHFSPALVFNLERHWNAKNRKL